MPVISQNKLVASVSSVHMGMAPVDICKTPAPPIPIPYPNIALSATMGPGYATKTFSIMTPIWTKKGKTAISNGDNAGVALGIMSSKVMGMCEIVMASLDVTAEGGGVVRTLDMTDQNG